MQIASHLVTTQSGPMLMVLDTTVDGRGLHVGLVMGEVRNGQPDVSALGEQCMARVRRRGLQHDAQSQLVLVALDEAEEVNQRMHRALGEADPADALVFVCRNQAAYSSALRRLAVRAAAKQLS